MVRLWVILTILAVFSMGGHLRAESQSTDYKGVADPFGDPANYEFADDEREDKEFFHLGRYLMLGVDFGTGIFTGGLGRTCSPSFYVGGKIVYFFDKLIAFEGGFHYGRHDNTMQTSSSSLKLDTIIIPITMGIRYYFDTKNAPKAIAVANPYIAVGGGIYMRSESVVARSGSANFNQGQSATTNNYGVYFGGGTEFNIYRKHIYLGLDLRYHFIFFNDEDSQNFGGLAAPGDRGGDYFTGGLSMTYNF